jgi:hypothetical protein
MTYLDALKAALRAAVRDGEREVARALTKAVVSEMRHQNVPTSGTFFSTEASR